MKGLFLRLIYSGFTVGGVLGALMWSEAALAGPDTVLSVQEAAQTVAVRNVMVQDNAVSGEIVNMSTRQLREVQLLIRHVWHWKNEFRPGQNPPAMAEFYTVEEEVSPGGTARFTYRSPSQLPSRSDGHFDTEVSVAGFTAIEQAIEKQRKDGGRERVL